MRLYSQNKDYKLYQGNMLDMLEVIEPNSIDSIITDPPYGLTSITKRFGKENSAECKYGKDGSFARLSRGFMGKEWDGSGIEYNIEAWQKCYEVLKPGGYLLAFGGSRTFHRIACAIEDAGFEIRDTIMWLYGSGFPKSLNLGKALDRKNGVDNIQHKGEWNFQHGNMEEFWKRKKEYKKEEDKPLETELAKQWKGWGTALKPSFEPIIVARKPFKGSLVDNVIEYGVGGINIDECRVGTEERTYKGCGKSNVGFIGGSFENGSKEDIEYNVNGRFPANTILTYDDTDFDEVCGGFPNTKSNGGKTTMSDFSKYNGSMMNTTNLKERSARKESNYIAPCDSGSASRYFYCAKASKKDRDEGLDEFEVKGAKELINREENSDGASCNGKYSSGNAYAGSGAPKKNTHPTVKPTELMQYLVRLVTPNNGIVLDPFNGSGSTGKAVMYENRERNNNYKYIGIELTKEYLPIAKARIEYVCDMSEKKLKTMQTSIFDFIGEDGNEL